MIWGLFLKPGATHLNLEGIREPLRSSKLLFIDGCVRECIAPSMRYSPPRIGQSRDRPSVLHFQLSNSVKVP
jgi:hypothetical protein